MKKFLKAVGIAILALLVLFVVVYFVPIKPKKDCYSIKDGYIKYNNSIYCDDIPYSEENQNDFYKIKELGFKNYNQKLKDFELMYNINYKDYRKIYSEGFSIINLLDEPHGFVINDDYILITSDLFGGIPYFLCIKENTEMPEFTAENIEGVYKYKWVIDDSNDYEGYGRLGLYTDDFDCDEDSHFYEFKPDEKAIVHTDSEYISNFVKTFNETNSISELSQALDKDENNEDIYYVVEFKDKSFPFCLVMSDDYKK